MNWHLILQLVMWLAIGIIISSVQFKLGDMIIRKSFRNKPLAFLGYLIYSASLFFFTVLFIGFVRLLVVQMTHIPFLDWTMWYHSLSDNWQLAVTGIGAFASAGLALSYLLWITLLKEIVYLPPKDPKETTKQFK